MNKETHYLHVSYMVTVDYGGITYGDILVALKGTMESLRETLREEIQKKTGAYTPKTPVIISMTELSESLYKTLMGE